MAKRITKIVLTGGPAAGKTTLVSRVLKEFKQEDGWRVITIPETATELISGFGIKPFDNCMSMLQFQDFVVGDQIHKEKLALDAAQLVPEDNILILYDRALMDDKAYVSDEEFAQVIARFDGRTEERVLANYDMVLHLITCAKGAEFAYDLGNNARTESIEFAREMDARTLRAWSAHPNLRIIDNDANFNNKIERALREIYLPAFEHIVKVGRTCWQDALPVTLGQEFSGFASAIRRQARALKALRPGCFELIMGGNAVGTGLGAQPGYMEAFYKAISAELGESVRPNPNLFDGFQNSDFILTVSGAVKTIAATLSKICKDLRLMSSGPRAGWMDINLPAGAPGSSIMPGNIIPTVPEMFIQIGHQVCGNDVAITKAIDEGDLDLNVWDATFYKCLFENLQLVGEEIVILRRDCVEGITANESRCKEEAESSIALSTVVAATFGYPQGVEVAHYCEKHRCNVKDAVVAMGLMTQEQAEILVDPSLMANPEKMAPIVARFKKELGILI